MSVPNIEKLFQYFHCISKEPIQFASRFDIDKNEYKNEIVCKDKITNIKLNKGFFLTDKCNMCGGCCPPESNLYTQSEYDKIQKFKYSDMVSFDLAPSYLDKLKSRLREESYSVNGKVIKIWVYKKESNQLYLPTREKIIERCSWCYQESETVFKCRIHPIESITCIMPHLRIFHVNGSNKSSIGISQFGRNWALKCPIEFEEPQSENQFLINKQNRIDKLNKLYEVGSDLNIDTYVPEIIKYVENIDFKNYKQYLNINILQKKPKSLF